MARDYAKKSSRPRHPPIPGWVWLISGLIIGLFVALLVYLDRQPAEPLKLPEITTPERMRDTRDVRKDAPEAPPAGPPRPRFEFYSILPELELAVPEEELERATSAPKPGDAAPARAAPTPGPTASPPSRPTSMTGTHYVLQAGSFKQIKEADGFKARLALLGLEASIQSVTINGTEWHRVRLGPFTDLKALKQTRKRLGDHGLEAIVLQVQG